ncbi:MAG TPA: SpoIIE family protein phosphatase [Kofleriaceae bacterium]|nr:SpoIIE family protein phosphatase [Kofleriaceae bacterium]
MKTAFWGRAILRAVPGVVLGAAACGLGLDDPVAFALGAAAMTYLAIDVLVAAPRSVRRAPEAPAGSAAERFLQRALELPSAAQVAGELSRAVATALGDPRTYLVVPGQDGAVCALGGDGQPALDLGDPGAAFAWLETFAEPLFAADIAAAAGDGPRAAAHLLATADCQVVLPLRHRGLLLGLALIGAADPIAHGPFLRAMRAYATVAVANTFLGQEATTRRRLTRAFDLAAAAQASILPDERAIITPQFELRGLCRPATECGGDLWAWRELGDGKVVVMIADATGHGAAPALLAAVAKGAAWASWELFDQGSGSSPSSPGDVLAAVGRAVCRTGRRRYFMTAFCAIVDTQSGELTYANAGQNFPYLVSGGKLAPLVARGDWLGDDPELVPTNHSRKLAPGDKIIFYTDGAIDAGEPTRPGFGDKRLRAAITELAGERAARLPAALYERIEHHLGASDLADDVTLVALELSPGGQPA